MRNRRGFGWHAFARSLLLCAAVVLLAGASASAAPRAWPGGSTPVTTVESLHQGPLLVDSRIAWLDSSSECVSGCRQDDTDFTERQRYRLRVAQPSRRPRVLFTTTTSSGSIGGADSFGGNLSIALSSSFLAVVATSSFDGREDSSFDFRLGAGPRPRSPRTARLRQIAKCSAFGISGSRAAFALSGSLLVHDAMPCEEGSGQSMIAFLDLATGSRRLEELPEDRRLVGLATAGRFAAASLSNRFDPDDPDFEYEYFAALFDRDRPGAIVTVSVGEGMPTLDVQRDGRIAICSDATLSTFSEAEPQPRELGACEGTPLIASDRVVFRAPNGDLQVSDLSGERQTIAQLGEVSSSGFDFDGRDVVYGLARCFEGTELLRATVHTRGRGRPTATCPASIRSRGPLRVSRTGATRFALGCPRGCDGFFDVFGPRYTVASGSFERRPGRSTVRVRLDRYGRRLLARRGSLRVRFVLTVDDRDGERRKVRRTLRLTR